MTPRNAYFAVTSKGSDDFIRESNGVMPKEVKENIKRFFQKAKDKVKESEIGLEEVPEGAF